MPRRQWRGAAIVLIAALALSGCGDPDLWARYQGERGFWQARRLLRRAELAPRGTAAGDWARAEAAFRQVAARLPAAIWTDPARLERPYARDVALLSGRATIAAARVMEARGTRDAALAAYREAERAYGGVRSVALEAALARAAALDRAGRGADATAAFAEVARSYTWFDAEDEATLMAVLDAPLRVARDHTQAGRIAEADSTLRATEAADVEALASPRGRFAAAYLWDHLARTRVAMGETQGALEALRGGIAVAPPDASLAPYVLEMAEVAIDGGLPDSAFAYTHWGERSFGKTVRGQAMFLAARAWQQRGPADSALDAWGRYLADFPRTADASTMARFQRGRLLEDLGRWELARGEYRALIAADATHELAFATLRRIVDWHARHGEEELARIQGRRGVESLDHLITTHRDERVLQLARRTRAELLTAIEEWEPACAALSDLWNRYGDAVSGLRAADIAESRLRDSPRAAKLYRDLADRAGADDDRRAAREALARLAPGRI